MSLYCTECRDLVYDPAAENVRSVTANLHRPSPKKRKSSDANGDDSYLTENSSQRKCGQEGVRGLFNLGETCYMNSILQMMVHNQLLSSYFLGDGHPVHSCPNEAIAEARVNGNVDDEEDESGEPKAEYQPCVGCAVGKVFAESRMSEKPEPMEAVNLLYASWKAIPVSPFCLSDIALCSRVLAAYGRQKPTRRARILHDVGGQVARKHCAFTGIHIPMPVLFPQSILWKAAQ